MAVSQTLEAFVNTAFRTNLDIFFAALKMSPSAQGYVNGSVTELLLKQHLEESGYEVERIREKWEGNKHPNHHGDFYFRKGGTTCWFVIESKGVKSNTEDWNKLYNLSRLKKILSDHYEIIHWIDKTTDIGPQINEWIKNNLPDLLDAPDMYSYEEIRKYLSNPPKKDTAKKLAMMALSGCNRDEIDAMIDARLKYVMSKVKVLDTHFVSGTSGSNKRTQATPRKDEFNVISVDIALRYDKHKFLFANPEHLASSKKDGNHLQQNYIMGFVFPRPDGSLKLDLSDEWFENFADAYATLSAGSAIDKDDRQIDSRNITI